MTIILQHQFWDLHVDDDGFEVGLSFGGIPERLGVPFEAVTAFFDPAVQFGFQFETLDAAGADGDVVPISGPDALSATEKPGEKPVLSTVEGKAVPSKAGTAKTTAKTDAGKAAASPAASSAEKPADEPPDRPAGGAGAEVVSLDRFRKK